MMNMHHYIDVYITQYRDKTKKSCLKITTCIFVLLFTLLQGDLNHVEVIFQKNNAKICKKTNYC